MPRTQVTYRPFALRSWYLCAIVVVFSTVLFAVPPPAPAENARLEQPVAQPIASIGGDVTEILYALGSEDTIAAVDTTSVYPSAALKTKPNVGYMRALSSEGVMATGAKTIIANERAGPPEVIAALKSANIAFHEIGAGYSAAGVVEKINKIGALVGKSAAAADLAANAVKSFERLARDRESIHDKKRVLFVLAVEDGRMTVGGSGTSADAILELAGAKNAASGINGFKPVTDEQLVELAPDAVVVMQRGGLKGDPVADVRKAKGLSASRAVADGTITGMEGQYLLGFGPRTASAATELMNFLYPKTASRQKAERAH